jgi:hypothetical protein
MKDSDHDDDFAGTIVAESKDPKSLELNPGPSRRDCWLIILGILVGPFVALGLLFGSGLFLLFVVLNDTVYSQGYRESAFKELRVGMTTEEVESRMGPPLAKYPGSDLEVWHFSKSRSGDGTYYVRVVWFRKNRAVSIDMDFFYE